MKIRDELIIRIIEDGLIDMDVIKNYHIMQLSSICDLIHAAPYGVYINALPDSIMRNWRLLGEEFESDDKFIEQNYTMFERLAISSPAITAYTFDRKSKTDYRLSDGFVEWIGNEYEKIKRKAK